LLFFGSLLLFLSREFEIIMMYAAKAEGFYNYGSKGGKNGRPRFVFSDKII